MKYTPSIERLKQPKRSPANESAPHWRTMTPGRYISTTLEIIYMNKIHSKHTTFNRNSSKGIKLNSKDFHWTYSPEKSVEATIIYSILQWDINGIKLAFSFSYFLQNTNIYEYYPASKL